MMFRLFKNKKVIITGNTGFKGSWLTLWLNILGAKIYGFSLNPSIPDWTVYHNQYEFGATMTALIYLEDEIVGLDEGDVLAAFINDIPIGNAVSEIVPFGPYIGSPLFDIYMYNHSAEGDMVNFKYFDFSSGEIYDINETLEFINNDIIGNHTNPYILNLFIAHLILPYGSLLLVDFLPFKIKFDIIVDD